MANTKNSEETKAKTANKTTKPAVKKAAPKATAPKAAAPEPKPAVVEKAENQPAPAKVVAAAKAGPSSEDKATIADMQRVLKLQQDLNRQGGPMSLSLRKDLLSRTEAMVQKYANDIVDVLDADFGSRSKLQSMASDVYGTVNALKHARKRVRKWMKPDRRSSEFPFNLIGAKSYVERHPYGTVGVISPWNFPFYLTFTPLAGVLSAGNRVMIKTSELTPKSAALMEKMVKETFDETEIAIYSGGPEIGAAFGSLHFDHILYTGGGRVGSLIMKAASEKLIPVTLELGGKSPVIVGESADMPVTAKRVMFGKTFNAGQICLAPDYVMVPEEKLEEFVTEAKSSVNSFYKDLLHNNDYTSIVNEGHFDRINGLVEDAKAKGARIEEINPADEDFSQQPHRKIAPTLIVNPTDDMKVMQEEIFGPVLPVVGYKKIDDAIGKVQDRDKPLGLYYFGQDKAEERQILNQTQSGGVTINDVLSHIQQEDLPFGGVGPSGIGEYQGKDGFLNFSHGRAVYRQSKLEKIVGLLRPPYNEKLLDLVKKQSGVQDTK